MLQPLNTLLNDLETLLQQGGWVLWLVFATCLVLWLCIFERLWFHRFEFQPLQQKLLDYWHRRTDKNSWLALATRDRLLSEIDLKLSARTRLIHTLIIVCPLMGLLGTVTGMINLFDLIAVSGNSDVKAMSAGIYRAILPTLAGLLVGLSGYYFAQRFSQKAERRLRALSDKLGTMQNTAMPQSAIDSQELN